MAPIVDKMILSDISHINVSRGLFKMHDVTDDLVKNRKESKTHFGDFVDKIIEVCNDANSPVTEDMIKSQGIYF